MSGIGDARVNISRRNLVKGAGAVGAIGLAGAAGMTTAQGWLGNSTAQAQTSESYHYTFHQGHCGGVCPLKCTVRDGRMVMVQPNPAAGEYYSTICLKGISEVQHIYGDKRNQVPLRRVGERGSGEFEQISWDEALDEIIEKVGNIQDQYGKQALMVRTTSESLNNHVMSLLQGQGWGFDGIDVGYGNGFDPAIGFGGGYATSSSEARDWVNSKLILSVGTNYLESSLVNVKTFFDAKDAGAKTITVDPNFSTTAGRSDEWVPIEPGTDAAFFLGMISHILENKLYDEDFVMNHTSMPFLVDNKTQLLIRDHEPRMVEVDGKEVLEDGLLDPFMVIDAATGEVVPYTEATNPALSAKGTDAESYATTVFDLLVENQKQYTPQWAESVSHVPAEKICDIAEQYAEGPSALALGWGGGDKMSNADIAGHASAILVALTGNIGKPGAAAGVFVGGAFGSCYGAGLAGWSLPEELAPSENEMPSYNMRTQENSVRAIIAFGDDLAQHYGNMSVTEDWYNSLDLIVECDPYFTESCKWADYVLPLTTRFENDGDYSAVRVGWNNIVMQNKVIDPLFEARTQFWLEREIASRLGIEDALPESPMELVDHAFEASEDPYVKNLSAEKINENDGVWPCENSEEPLRHFTDFNFFTTSHRMDVYYDNMVPFDQALPQWDTCSEAYEGNPLREKYPLQFANTRTRFRIHNQFNDALWLQELYQPTVDVNPKDMEARGIKNGQAVTISNDRGKISVYANANESIRPGSARLYEAATADFTLEGNMQTLTNDYMTERGYSQLCGPVTPFSDTLVEIEKA